MLSCGHQCPSTCGKPCDMICLELVRRRLDCGHNINVPCHEGEVEKQCEIWSVCGHSVMMPCYAGTNPSHCPAQCGKELPCGHNCLRRCGECFDAGECKCEAVCSKLLPCAVITLHRENVVCHASLVFLLVSQVVSIRTAAAVTVIKVDRCIDSLGTEIWPKVCSEIVSVLCQSFATNSCRSIRTVVVRSAIGTYAMCDSRAIMHSIATCQGWPRLSRNVRGSFCPSLCGTCNKRAYVKLIEEFLGAKESLTKLPRIIQVEGCHHVFPVEILDKHAKIAQNQSLVLICPQSSCNQPITRIQRYMKLIKKRNLERYNQRIATAISVPPDKAKSLMSGYMDSLIAEQKKIFGILANQRLSHKQLFVDVRNLLTDAHRTIAVDRLMKPDSCVFWREYT
ncbi:hypothetical protein OSTOST_24034, partial [Ostertagia ostertagi]